MWEQRKKKGLTLCVTHQKHPNNKNEQNPILKTNDIGKNK